MLNVFSRESTTLPINEFTDQKAGIRRLLSLPSIQLHVIRACNDPLKTNEQISNLLKYEPTLVAKLLNITPNGEQSSDVQERIKNTPRQTIKQLILSGCSERYALYQASRKETFDFLKQQWVVSLQVAFLSKAFAYQFGYHKPEQAFYAGLLHNIGQLLFQSEDIDDYLLLLQNASTNHELLELETQNYGFNHAVLGAYLAQQWGLDSAIQDAIRYHHSDIEKIQDAHLLTRIVFLSRSIAENPFSSFKELMLFSKRLFNADHEQFIPLVESALSQTGDIIQALNVNIPSRLVAQSLVPFLPEEQAHSQLQEAAKNHQLMKEIHTSGVIDAVDIALSQASNELELQAIVNNSATALYSATKCLFFQYKHCDKALHGTNLSQPNCVTNEIVVQLSNEHSLLAKAYRSKFLVDTFKIPIEELSVIDREIMEHSQARAIIFAPIILPIEQGIEAKPWGILVMGFDANADFQQASIQASVRYFSQRVATHLQRIDQFQTVIRQAQETEKGLHTTSLKRLVHEVNNPLSIVQNSVHILAVKHQDQEHLKNQLQNIQEEVSRASELLKNNLDQSLNNKSSCPSLNVNELVSDLILVFKESFLSASDIVCNLELDQTIPPVYIDESALKQILTNLVKNAAESMKDGGWLGVNTFDQVIINDNAYLEIQVIDDGPGLPKKVVENLFSPVDSNKGIGHAGLGLSIVKELAQQIGGFVSYRRTPGEKTIFSLFLPRNTEPKGNKH